MNFEQFKNWALAQGSVAKYNDGQFGGECVSLINQKAYRVDNVPAGAWGDAKSWGAPGNAALNYYNIVGDLQPGDILVYGATSGNPYGHIELYAGNGQALGQNRRWDRRVRLEGMLKGYVRILRSKTSQGDNMAIIQNAENWYARCNDTHWLILDVEFPRSELVKWAGQDFLKFVEACRNNPHSNVVQGWQQTGKIAVQDNWPQQIYDLQARVAELNKRPTAEQLAELNKAAEDLKKQADVAENKALKAEMKAAEAITENTKLSNQADEDKNVADNFMRRIGQWISKYIPGGK